MEGPDFPLFLPPASPEAHRGVVAAVLRFVRQFVVLLRYHVQSRQRRKLHAAAELLSPMVLLLVLVYGTHTAPDTSVAVFDYTATPTVPMPPPPPPNTTTSMYRLLQQAGLVAPNSRETYFETEFLPEFMAANGSITTKIADIAKKNVDVARPFSVMSLDSFMGLVNTSRANVGAEGRKALMYQAPPVWRALHFGRVAFVPDTDEVRRLMRFLDATTNTFRSTAAFPEPFESVDAVYATGDEVWAVVEFTEFDTAAARFSYSIHMNSTYLPATAASKIIEPFPQGIGKDFSDYLLTGFSTLQLEVNEYLSRRARVVNPNASALTLDFGLLPFVESLCGEAAGDTALFAQPTSFIQVIALNEIKKLPPPAPTVLPVDLAAWAVDHPCLYELMVHCDAVDPSNGTAALRCLSALNSTVVGDVCTAALELFQPTAYEAQGVCGPLLNGCNVQNTTAFTPQRHGALAHCIRGAQAAGGRGLPATCGAAAFVRQLSLSAALERPCSAAARALDPTLCPDAEAAQAPCHDDLRTVCVDTGTDPFPALCLWANRGVLSDTCKATPVWSKIEQLGAANATVEHVTTALNLCRLATTARKNFNRGIAVAAFPTPAVSYSTFLRTTAPIFALVVAMAFVLPFTVAVRSVVQERETQRKTLLLTMGVGRFAQFAAHLTSIVVINVLGALPAALLLWGFVLPNTGFGLLFAAIAAYGYSLAGFTVLLGRFFYSGRTAASVAPFVLFLSAVPAFVTMERNAGALLSPSAAVLMFDYVVLFEQSTGRRPGLVHAITLGSASVVVMGTVYALLAWLLEWVAASARHGVVATARAALNSCVASCAKSIRGSKVGQFLAGPSADGQRGAAADDAGDEYLVAEEMISQRRDDGGSPARTALAGAAADLALTSQPLPKSAVVAVRGRDMSRAAFPHTGSRVEVLFRAAVDCFDSCVNAVIGPHRSGKSTLLRVLVALEELDDGDALILGNPCHEFPRKCLGVCLSHDIVWDTLTVEQHLRLFSSAKGCHDVDTDIAAVAAALGIESILHRRCRTLSPGHRRAVAVGMALVGQPRVIALDEPTKGMDPAAAARLHALLAFLKEGRCIVTASQDLPPASTVDHAVLLVGGRVCATGSPAHFLRSTKAPMAVLSVVRLHESETPAVSPAASAATNGATRVAALEHRLGAVVTAAVPAAVFAGTSGGTMSWRVPATGPDLRQAVDAVESAGLSLGVAVASIASESIDDLLAPSRTDVVDGDAVTGRCVPPEGFADAGETYDSPVALMSPLSPRELAPTAGCDSVASALLDTEGQGEDQQRDATAKGKVSESGEELGRIGMPAERESRVDGCTRHSRMLGVVIAQRLALGLTQLSSALAAFIFPLLCIGVALAVMHIKDPAPVDLVLCPIRLFGSGQEVLVTDQHLASPSYHGANAAHFESGAVRYVDISAPKSSAATPQSSGTVAVTAVLKAEETTHVRQRFGGLALNDTLYRFTDSETGSGHGELLEAWNTDIVLHNSTSPHALPAYVSLLQTMRLRAFSERPGARITVTNSPRASEVFVPSTSRLIRNLVSAVLFIIPFAFFPASMVAEWVREKELGHHVVQHASMLTPAHRLIGGWVWNGCVFFVFSLVTMQLLEIFGPKGIIATNADSFSLLLLCAAYGFSAISQSYFFGLFFHSHATAQNGVMLFLFLTGFGLVCATYGVDTANEQSNVTPSQSAKDANKVVTDIARVFPAFALGNALLRMSNIPTFRFYERSETTVWAAVSPELSQLFIPPVLLYILLAVFEVLRRMGDPKKARDANAVPPTVPIDGAGTDAAALLPTAAEPSLNEGLTAPPQATASSGLVTHMTTNGHARGSHAPRSLPASSEALIAEALSAGYETASCGCDGPVVLNDVSLAVEPGQCLVLLGPSGSGKSTLLAALAGELKPARGSVAVGDVHAWYQWSDSSSDLGVCLATDGALDDAMTPYLMLQQLADCRGLRVTALRERHVVGLLYAFGITGAAMHTPLRDCDTAVRRLTSFAAAIVGCPRTVLLDEPTTGLDPTARRVVWSMVRCLQRSHQCRVVLATNSTSECAAVASHVALLRDGTVVENASVATVLRRWPLRCTVQLLSDVDSASSKAVEDATTTATAAAAEQEALLTKVATAAESAAPHARVVSRHSGQIVWELSTVHDGIAARFGGAAALWAAASAAAKGNGCAASFECAPVMAGTE